MKRNSKKRDAILEALCSVKTHPSAEDVYNMVTADYPDISPATVYRNLSAMAEEGSIQRVATVDGCERYDGNAKPHPHFICRRCSRVIDIEPESIVPQLSCREALENALGVEVESESIIFYGLCENCKNML